MSDPIVLDNAATTDLARRVADLGGGEAADIDSALGTARLLGAHTVGMSTQFGFWVPDRDPDTPVTLQILRPPAGFDPTLEQQHIEFEITEVPMTVIGGVAVCVVTGVRPGTRSTVGDLYRSRWTIRGSGQWFIDPLALSMPFGAFAPSEVIDLEELHLGRGDGELAATLVGPPGADGIGRVRAPTNLLQVHPGTATSEGTIAALAQLFRDLAARVESGASFTPDDLVWLGYDGIELMPIEPTVVHEAGPAFWEEDDGLVVTLRRPDTTDWGYDVVIAGGAAVNPALLKTGRPHELVDLATALHAFPGGPIQLVIDVVYGHTDNQGLGVLAPAWMTGPDMYGQHLDYRNPMVRAQLLEMQRRKADFGVDAIRVDGAQDFTWYDQDGTLHYHDQYMLEMSDVVQEVDGHRYRPFMIFEDGRPWPRPDWELASSYRAVIDRQDHVVQWGPLTFAHNTPFLFTFWVAKWWRLREIAEVGSTWISGCANHDTLRRGMQVDPDGFINSYLGDTNPEIIRNAYDSPAANLLFHGFLPGIPMDFINANVRGAWSFIRNVDARFAVKVWAEEARFLDWHVTPEWFEADDAFPRLKAAGFTALEELRRFMAHLARAVELYGDDDAPVPDFMQAADPPFEGVDLDRASLRASARAWMDDVHDYCSVPRWSPDAARADFSHALRAFRRSRPWLRGDLRDGDRFDYSHPTEGSVVFTGVRASPDGTERVGLIVNMEGSPASVVPGDELGLGDWQPAIVAPDVDVSSVSETVELANARGVLFVAR